MQNMCGIVKAYRQTKEQNQQDQITFIMNKENVSTPTSAHLAHIKVFY